MIMPWIVSTSGSCQGIRKKGRNSPRFYYTGQDWEEVKIFEENKINECLIFDVKNQSIEGIKILKKLKIVIMWSNNPDNSWTYMWRKL